MRQKDIPVRNLSKRQLMKRGIVKQAKKYGFTNSHYETMWIYKNPNDHHVVGSGLFRSKRECIENFQYRYG